MNEPDDTRGQEPTSTPKGEFLQSSTAPEEWTEYQQGHEAGFMLGVKVGWDAFARSRDLVIERGWGYPIPGQLRLFDA